MLDLENSSHSDVVFVKLTRGKVAVVDRRDAALVDGRNWHAVKKCGLWYAASRINYKIVYMHRWIMRPPPQMQIDHIDDDGLNNRRSNMRICTRFQNSLRRRRVNSSSGFRGVREHQGHWTATITLHGKRIYLGFFKDKTVAAQAYDAAAREHYGDFARLNFP